MARLAFIKLEKGKKFTERQSFLDNETSVEMVKTEAKIKNLTMVIARPGGSNMQVRISGVRNFMGPVIEKKGDFEFVFFRYKDTDKDCIITLKFH
jgi:hypothetical protein